MNSILFEKRNYRIRQVEVEDLGIVNIASTKLNDKLLTENGKYKSIEASNIDEQIYFFVHPRKLNANDSDLIKYLNKYCT